MEDFSISVVFSGLLGSILTMIFTKFYDDCRQKKNFKIEQKNLAKALKTEISVLVKMYQKIKLPENPPNNGSNLNVAYISQNYISVYENNTNRLGILNSDDIPKIIELYMCIKYLIDSLQWLSQRWEIYSRYGRTPNYSSKELILKGVDVENAYNAAREGEKIIFNLYNDVLNRLSKY